MNRSLGGTRRSVIKINSIQTRIEMRRESPERVVRKIIVRDNSMYNENAVQSVLIGIRELYLVVA